MLIIILQLGTRLFFYSTLGLATVTLISMGKIQNGCTVIKVYYIELQILINDFGCRVVWLTCRLGLPCDPWPATGCLSLSGWRCCLGSACCHGIFLLIGWNQATAGVTGASLTRLHEKQKMFRSVFFALGEMKMIKTQWKFGYFASFVNQE